MREDLKLDYSIAIGVHRGCGGLIFPHVSEGYQYCSNHGGECDCEGIRIPAIYCDNCGNEIGGDAEIEVQQ